MAYDINALFKRLPRDEELENAQADQAQQEKWDRVSDDLYGAFSRQPGYKSAPREGPADKLLKQRKSVMEQLGAAKQADELSAANDPDDLGTKLSQDLIAKHYQAKGLPVPPEVQNATGGQLQRFLPMLKEIDTAEKTKKALALAANDRVGMIAAAKRMEDEMGVPEGSRTDWQQYSDAGLNEAIKRREVELGRLQSRQHMQSNESTQREKLGQGRERIGIANQKLGLTQLHAAGEAQKAMPTGRALIDSSRPPVPEQARAVEEMDASNDQVQYQMGKALGLLTKNNGRMLPTSADAEQFQSTLAGALGNLVKAANFGNMTKAHQDLTHELVKNPSSLFAWFNNDISEKQIHDLLDDIGHSISVTERRFNFRPLRAGEKQQANPYAPKEGLTRAKQNAVDAADDQKKAAPEIPDGTTKVVGGTTYVRHNGGWEAR